MSKPVTANDLANLSNEDVRLLYDIVSAAEKSTAPPFRSLFSAYDEILTKNGIPKDSDHTYLRFLLRMGEGRKDGVGLFDQFELLLAKLGIHVAFDEEDDGPEGLRSAGASDKAADSPSIKRLQTQPFRPARRGSLDSVLDANAETQKSFDRLRLLATRPRSTEELSSGKALQLGRDVDDAKTEVPLKSAMHRSRSMEGRIARGRLSPQLGRRRAPIGHAEPSAGLTSMEEHRPEDVKSDKSVVLADSGAESVDDYEESDNAVPSPMLQDTFNQPLSIAPIWPTAQRMENYAKTLRFHHMAANAVKFFRHWRAMTEQTNKQHLTMTQIATSKDGTTLKRQAFDQWRVAVAEEQQLREARKAFHSLEVRAEFARNMFLLTKAFTHWAQCASEEVLRKAANRKTYLKVKYFNAWRDIAILNELKVRRQGLYRYLDAWKKRTAHAMSLDKKAICFRTSHATNEAYRSWFWHFCERRAPQWYISKVQRTLFGQWVEATRTGRVRLQWALDFRNLELLRRCLVCWTQRSYTVQQSVLHAIDIRRRMLVIPAIEAFQRELRLAPLQTEARGLVNARVVRSALAVWFAKARGISQAQSVNRLRTVRNAWTKWNDMVRCQALSRTIKDRIATQALYRWVLAERLALFKRVREEMLIVTIFSRWHCKTNALGAYLGRATYIQRQTKERRTKAYILGKWTSLTEAGKQEDLRAQAYRHEKLSSTAVQIWTAKYRQVEVIENWAQDARFYVLTKRSIKSWNEQTIEAKKTKRRHAYSLVRRKTKMNLARTVLDQWRESTARKSLLTMSGQEAYWQHLGQLNLALFSHWQLRSAKCQELTKQANSTYEARLTLTHVRILSSRVSQNREELVRAEAFFSESVNATANNCLRKLEWQVFQSKSREESAERLMQRNSRNHRKRMVRHWADAAISRRRPPLHQGEAQLVQSSAPEEPVLPVRMTDLPPRSGQGTPGPRNLSHLHFSKTITAYAAPSAPSGGQPYAATPAYLRTPSRHFSKTRPTGIMHGAQTQPHLQRYQQNIPNSSLYQQSLEFGQSSRNLEEPQVVRTSTSTVQPSQFQTLTSPSTPAPPPSSSVRPFTFHADTQPSQQQGARSQTQLTPFMSRLRARYQAPNADGLLEPLNMLVGTRSGLRREFPTPENENTRNANPASEARRGSFDIDGNSEGREEGSDAGEVG